MARPSEQVLCLRREDVFPDGAWDGLVSEGLDRAQRLIRERSLFLPRRDVEEDPRYQQVIPYVVFRHGDRYFLTRRLRASSERRLRHQYSLGLGGHINPEDVANGDPVSDGMRREWEEEVVYAGSFRARLLGLVHEESAPVGRVHLGLVFLIDGDSPDIAIRETDKLSGELLTLEAMRIHYLEMEGWSQLVYDRLVEEAGSGSASPSEEQRAVSIEVGGPEMGDGQAYTGKVVPGGPPDVRELQHLTITKLSVGSHDNNAYLLRCRQTGEQLLVDAPTDAARLLEVTGPAGLATVVTTHGHSDHWQALREVARATGAETVAHPLDAGALPVPPSRLVEEGDRVRVGACELEVIHLAGHTPGGIAMLYEDPGGAQHLFSGDSLFPGGVGNTDSDPERFRSLMTDVERKVFDRLPDATWVYPGHGNDTTLGAERGSLAEWWERGW